MRLLPDQKLSTLATAYALPGSPHGHLRLSMSQANSSAASRSASGAPCLCEQYHQKPGPIPILPSSCAQRSPSSKSWGPAPYTALRQVPSLCPLLPPEARLSPDLKLVVGRSLPFSSAPPPCMYLGPPVVLRPLLNSRPACKLSRDSSCRKDKAQSSGHRLLLGPGPAYLAGLSVVLPMPLSTHEAHGSSWGHVGPQLAPRALGPPHERQWQGQPGLGSTEWTAFHYSPAW